MGMQKVPTHEMERMQSLGVIVHCQVEKHAMANYHHNFFTAMFLNPVRMQHGCGGVP